MSPTYLGPIPALLAAPRPRVPWTALGADARAAGSDGNPWLIRADVERVGDAAFAASARAVIDRTSSAVDWTRPVAAKTAVLEDEATAVSVAADLARGLGAAIQGPALRDLPTWDGGSRVFGFCAYTRRPDEPSQPGHHDATHIHNAQVVGAVIPHPWRSRIAEWEAECSRSGIPLFAWALTTIDLTSGSRSTHRGQCGCLAEAERAAVRMMLGAP